MKAKQCGFGIAYALAAIALAGIVATAMWQWSTFKEGLREEGRQEVTAKWNEERLLIAAVVKQQELDNERAKQQIQQAAVAAVDRTRQADARVATAESMARRRLRERNLALRDLADVRRVLIAGDSSPAASPAADPAGAAGADTGADLAGRLLACTSALGVTVDTMAVNNANHLRALARIQALVDLYEAARE
jgi:DNA-binding transcriptional regulator of glucitol operon